MGKVGILKIKRCSGKDCGEKSLDCFGKNSSKKDGLQDYCGECKKNSQKKYNQTNKGRKAQKKAHKKYNIKHPNRRRAKDAVKQALLSGKLKKGCCEICGLKSNIEGHHNSYEKSQWLIVNWLCRKHHIEKHNRLRNLKLEKELS